METWIKDSETNSPSSKLFIEENSCAQVKNLGPCMTAVNIVTFFIDHIR